jgi:hypothetical protein
LINVPVPRLCPENVTLICPLPAVAAVTFVGAVGGAAAAAIVNVTLSAGAPVPLASVAVQVTVAVPAVVGVPLITPVAEFKLRPAGSVPDAIKYVAVPWLFVT